MISWFVGVLVIVPQEKNDELIKLNFALSKVQAKLDRIKCHVAMKDADWTDMRTSMDDKKLLIARIAGWETQIPSIDGHCCHCPQEHHHLGSLTS